MLMRRVPLPRKRAIPRRSEGRVDHGRVKARGRFPDKHVKEYWSSLERRCVVCGAGDTVIHHILARLPQKTRQRDHRYVAVLCASHHNMGDASVHMLGTEAAFQEATGIDLVSIAVDNWSNWNG